MKRILREPLVHFILIGGALFAVNALLSRRETPARIVVTQGRIESLATAFGLTWQRPPTPEELEGLIRDYVREEVAVREAVKLGLDRDDTIIRRRLRQKLEFVSEDVAARAEPTDDQLRAWLDAHPGDFGIEPRFTFDQVYLDPGRHGANLARDATQLLARLRREGSRADLASLGEPFLLGHRFDALPARDVKSQFGDTFATTLDTLAPGHWRGPVESGYGAHLVLLHERTAARAPVFAEVRDAVRREWSNAQRVEASERLYQELLARYTVTIEKPAAGADTAGGTPGAAHSAPGSSPR
jgi:hypothetical protein